MDTSNAFDLRLPAEMAKVAEQAGLYKVSKKKELSFFLAVTAGVFISIAFVFYITVTTGPAPATALAKLGAASASRWASFWLWSVALICSHRQY